MNPAAVRLVGVTVGVVLVVFSAACGRTLGTDRAICGDEIREGEESCDSTDLGGQTCASLGHHWGQLACDSSCELDTSGCFIDEAYCGDGVVGGDEACDVWDLSGFDCLALGFGGGELYCSVECTFETAQCIEPYCGDGLVHGAEQCDDGNTGFDDGCHGCLIDDGWQCQGEPSVCCSRYWQGPECTGPCVVHVDGASTSQVQDGVSWSTAFVSPQDGIDTAFATNPGCEVWVAEGTYHI